MNKFKRFFNGFRKGMKLFGNAMSTIVNTALLSAVYLLGVGATALIAKIKGKKFLETDISRNTKTYWKKLDLKTKHIDEYYRQF